MQFYLKIINFSAHFEVTYVTLTELSQQIKELNKRSAAVEKKVNRTTSGDPPILDVSNMQHSLPLKTTDDVKALERNLSENLEEYNKFVNSILALLFT